MKADPELQGLDKSISDQLANFKNAITALNEPLERIRALGARISNIGTSLTKVSDRIATAFQEFNAFRREQEAGAYKDIDDNSDAVEIIKSWRTLDDIVSVIKTSDSVDLKNALLRVMNVMRIPVETNNDSACKRTLILETSEHLFQSIRTPSLAHDGIIS